MSVDLSNVGSFTLDEWCEYRRVSRGMFYKLEADGKAPLSYTVGKRRMISREADQAWVADRMARAVPVRNSRNGRAQAGAAGVAA